MSKKTGENKDLITLQEAADILGMRPITLRKWDREEKLVAIRVGPRRDRRYKKEDIDRFLEMTQAPKINWQEYIRSGASHRVVGPAVRGLTHGLSAHFGRSVKYLMNYFEGDTLYWYYDSRDVYDTGRTIVEKLMGSNKFADRFFKRWDQTSDSILRFIDYNSSNRLAKVSDKLLAKIYKQYSDAITDWYSVSISIDATDESLMTDITTRLKNILKKQLKSEYSEKKFLEVYNALTAPSKLSYVADERKMLLTAAKDFRNGLLDIDALEADHRVGDIVKKFWWTGLGWARSEIRTVSDVVADIKEILHSEVDIDKDITRFENYEEDVKANKEKIDKRHAITQDEELSAWLQLSDRLAEYHDFRKEVQVKSAFWGHRFMDELSRRKGISHMLLDWCDNDEILELLRGGNIDEYELNQRSSKFLYINIDGKITRASGKEASRLHKEATKMEGEMMRDLQGTGASEGKVTGKAFVAVTAKSAIEIEPGQILVTGMTTPDFVPAMKKAAAIVTDEGGITCHAAIISRELGIPCIVGTRMGTKVIKSGDILEVAANHGVVKIL